MSFRWTCPLSDLDHPSKSEHGKRNTILNNAMHHEKAWIITKTAMRLNINGIQLLILEVWIPEYPRWQRYINSAFLLINHVVQTNEMCIWCEWWNWNSSLWSCRVLALLVRLDTSYQMATNGDPYIAISVCWVYVKITANYLSKNIRSRRCPYYTTHCCCSCRYFFSFSWVDLL
jgi:hypothetical protein